MRATLKRYFDALIARREEGKDEGFSLCGRPARRGAFCLAHGALAYRRPDRQHLLKLAGLA